MLRKANFEKLIGIMLDEGQTCECPHKDTCGHKDEAWCRHIIKESNHVEIVGYEDLSISRCMYREQPGCCWVLAEVETLATNYLTKFKISRPPVPSEFVGAFDTSREIDVRTLPLKGYHGAAWLLGTEWVIQLNEIDSPQIRRQTLFHEAFHIACRNASPEFKRRDLKYKPFRDLLADHFATCILMPKYWVEKLWPGTGDAKKMAGIFNVSVQAMQHRLEQLGLPSNARLSISSLSRPD